MTKYGEIATNSLFHRKSRPLQNITLPPLFFQPAVSGCVTVLWTLLHTSYRNNNTTVVNHVPDEIDSKEAAHIICLVLTCYCGHSFNTSEIKHFSSQAAFIFVLIIFIKVQYTVFFRPPLPPLEDTLKNMENDDLSTKSRHLLNFDGSLTFSPTYVLLSCENNVKWSVQNIHVCIY